MNKIILLILGSLFYSQSCLCQVSDSGTSTILLPYAKKVLVNPIYIKYSHCPQNNFKQKGMEVKNIKLTKLKSNIIQIDSFDKCNSLISQTHYKIQVRRHFINISADSFLYNKNIHDTSITYYNDIIEHFIVLEKNGKYKEFHKNKALKIKGLYKFDRKNGKWKYYNEDGKLLKIERWNNSLLIHTKWRKAGVLSKVESS